MKIAIVDDEKKATDLIKKYIDQFTLEYHFEIQVSVFHNPQDFLLYRKVLRSENSWYEKSPHGGGHDK